MIKTYFQYLNDNPQGYWFKARWFGWGWVPVTWQGWGVVALYLLIVILLGMLMPEDGKDTSFISSVVLLLTFIATALLILLCYKKGEKPHWSWGKPKKR